MKKVELNSGQNGLLTSALLKNLFPKPDSGELLVSDLGDNETCYYYFEGTYYDRLIKEIRMHLDKGSFARSNSEQDWIDLMKVINAGIETSDKEELKKLKPHFLAG
jgi:hypothetical protein